MKFGIRTTWLWVSSLLFTSFIIWESGIDIDIKSDIDIKIDIIISTLWSVCEAVLHGVKYVNHQTEPLFSCDRFLFIYNHTSNPDLLEISA